MTQQKKSVLVIRLSALGDLVLATAALGALTKAGYSVSLVTKAQFAPLFEGQPGVEEVFAFDKLRGESIATQEMLAWARAKKFDFVLDLQNSWRTWSWRGRLRSIAPVHALAKPRLREWLVLFLRLGRWIGLGRGGRAARFRDAALAAIGQQSPLLPPSTRLEVSEKECLSVKNRLPSGEFAVLLPAGAWKSKEWPYFPELARRIAAKMPVVVLGGSKDEVCETVARAAREVNPESRTLHGLTSLRESMAILSQARWIIGNDTGMVHVGEALGKSVAMIEGPTHPYMGFSPYRSDSQVIGLPLACRPCSKSGKVCLRFGTRLCLRGLSVELVAKQLGEAGYPC